MSGLGLAAAGPWSKHLTSVCFCHWLQSCLACRRRQEHCVELQRRADRHPAHADRGTPRRHHLPGAAGVACAVKDTGTGSWQCSQPASRLVCAARLGNPHCAACLPDPLPRHCPHLPPPCSPGSPTKRAGWPRRARMGGCMSTMLTPQWRCGMACRSSARPAPSA